MNQRGHRLRALCGLLAFCLPAAAGGSPDSQVGAPSAATRPASGIRERFRFHAGAPLLAPAGVGEDGSVCVGTADGYVHALAPDGSYRWSFTVRGSVTRRPLFVAGLWFVVSSSDRVYALTPEGTLSWVFRPPAAIDSELAAGASGPAYFVGADEFLYGITGHGGVAFRAPFGKLEAGPTAAADGAIWVKNRAGSVVRVLSSAVARFAAAAPVAFEFGSPERVVAEGRVWETHVDGSLTVVRSETGATESRAVSSSALLPARWSERERELVVSAREGLVVAVRLAADSEPEAVR